MATYNHIAPAANSDSEEADEVEVKYHMLRLRELVNDFEAHHPAGAPFQEAEHWDEMVSLSSRLVNMGANECLAPSAIVTNALNIHRLSKHQARMKQMAEIRKKLDAITAKLAAIEGRAEKLEHEVDALPQVQRVLDHLLWLTDAVLRDPDTHHHFGLTAFEIEVLRIKECGMNLPEDVDKAEICMESALAMERASDAWQRGRQRRGLLMQFHMKLKALSGKLKSGEMRQAAVSSQMIAEWREVIEDKVFTGEMSEYVRGLVETVEACLQQLPAELKQHPTKLSETGANAAVANA